LAPWLVHCGRLYYDDGISGTIAGARLDTRSRRRKAHTSLSVRLLIILEQNVLFLCRKSILSKAVVTRKIQLKGFRRSYLQNRFWRYSTAFW
jgi:hypothetical protein